MAFGVHVARTPVSTSASGTADVTDSGFGTYKLAISLGSRHASGDSDDAAIAGATISFGFALNDDDECAHRHDHRDNNATQVSGGGRAGSLSGGGFYGTGDNGHDKQGDIEGHQTVITDGLQLVNTRNRQSLASNVITTMLNGSDIANIEMGFHTLNTTPGDYSITNLGSFEPDLIMLQMGNHVTYTSTWATTVDGRQQLGFATNGDITGGGDLQAAINNDSAHANATGKPSRTVRNDCMLCGLDSTPALRFKVALKGFISNGFDITTTAGVNNPTGEFMWVAIKFAAGTVEPRILFRDAPTSTGDDGGFTGLGIDPDWAWIIQTAFASADINTIQDNGKSGSISHAFVEKNGSVAFCASFISEHGPATTNTECTTSAKACFMARDDGDTSAGNCYDVTVVTLQTDGIKRTWPKVFTAARQEIIIAIGPATAAGDDHTIIPAGAASVVVAANGVVDVELAPAGAASVTVAANASITQGHVLTAQGAATITVAANGVVDVEIAPAGAAAITVAANGVIDVEVKPAGAATLPVAANATITQGHVLTAQGAASVTVAASGSIFPDITAQGAAAVMVAANATITEEHILTAQGAATVTVVANGSIFPDISSQGVAVVAVAANASITQGHVLSAQGAAVILAAANGVISLPAPTLPYYLPLATERDRTPTFAAVARVPTASSPTRIPVT